MRIGVVGFSRNSFDKKTARRILEGAFIELSQKFKSHQVEIVSGYTKAGVPAIAYELAEKFGFRTTGISAKQALRVKSGTWEVDKVILHGEKFGDESQIFVDYIDGLLRVGGGSQSRQEVEMFSQRFSGEDLSRRLREFEVDCYDQSSQPANINYWADPEVETFELSPTEAVRIFRGVDELTLSTEQFNALWDSHPAEFHEVMMHGKLVKTPRWQQAYGRNYSYSGSRNNALEITPVLQSQLDWCKVKIDSRLNGLLLNWYAGRSGHYIGAHRDDVRNLISETPIITISHGGCRIFRFRPYAGKGYRDILVSNGDVVVISAAINQRWTHEVPKLKRYADDRISVTIRAFR